MSENYFMGLDGFVWFTGVVEDRNDPDKLGRVRVRCLGFHTEDLVDIPTADLPWATVMHPVTDPSMQGLGNSPSFLVEGSWVIGFFSDANLKQQPIIIGSLPGIPLDAADPTKGFNDPRSANSFQEDYLGTPSYGPYPVDGEEYDMPSGHSIGESDTNKLAQGQYSEEHDALIRRRTNQQKDIPTATQPNLSTVSDSAVIETRDTFNEPDPKGILENADPYFSSQYPYNHVFESESGHITEIDDSPGGERILKEHKSGTYEEIIANGSKTVKVIGDNCEIIMGGSDVYIAGAVNLTIGGTVRHLVKGDYHLEVEGNYTQKIHKNMRTKIGAGVSGGNLEEEIKGNHAFNISNNIKGRIGEDVDVTTEGNEQRINNGTYKLVAKSNIFAATTGGTLTLNASGNVSIDTTSGIMAIKSGTTLNMKSATAMTVGSETTFTGTSTGIGTFTFSGDGSNFIANNGSGVAIGLTTHTHTQDADSDGDTQATTNVPNA